MTLLFTWQLNTISHKLEVKQEWHNNSQILVVLPFVENTEEDFVCTTVIKISAEQITENNPLSAKVGDNVIV